MYHVESPPEVFAGGPRPRVFAALEGDGAFVWLCGDHDASTVAELSRIVDHVLDFADVTFDLSAVTFMDSTTVAVITQAEEYLLARSRSVAVRAPSRFARLVLDPHGLRDFVDPDWA
jgi:anti-anti-sigma factor